MFDCPVFITVRDRVRDLRTLVEWLESAGHQRLHLIDNDSTWEPCVEYLKSSPHDVIHTGKNGGSRMLWDAELVPRSEPFVLTDPDIVPIDDCPLNAIEHLHDILERHSGYHKAGLGLYLEDVPATMPSLGWERGPSINGPLLEPGVRQSLIDTTFALHRAGTPFMFEAIRTETPYVARHMSWYSGVLDVEDRYYLDHALGGPLHSSWVDAA